MSHEECSSRPEREIISEAIYFKEGLTTRLTWPTGILRDVDKAGKGRLVEQRLDAESDGLGDVVN
jgi:hypothetical protein